MNLNESVILITSIGSRDAMSLLYKSTAEQQTVFAQSFKLYYTSMLTYSQHVYASVLTCCQHVMIFFTDMSTRKQDLDDSPSGQGFPF